MSEFREPNVGGEEDLAAVTNEFRQAAAEIVEITEDEIMQQIRAPTTAFAEIPGIKTEVAYGMSELYKDNGGRPSMIQFKSIPLILEGKHVVACSETGVFVFLVLCYIHNIKGSCLSYHAPTCVLTHCFLS